MFLSVLLFPYRSSSRCLDGMLDFDMLDIDLDAIAFYGSIHIPPQKREFWVPTGSECRNMINVCSSRLFKFVVELGCDFLLR
jgi:hypothetical protein